jgi:hypothetical protein
MAADLKYECHCRRHHPSSLAPYLLRRWVAEPESTRTPIAIQRTVPLLAPDSPDSFVPVPIPANSAEGVIRIKIGRGPHQIRTRFSGETYSELPGLTSNAAYQASMFRTTPLTRYRRGLWGSLTTCFFR